MDTATQPSPPAQGTPPSSAMRRAEVGLLIGAPVVLLLGRALLVPFDDQQWDGMLTTMAEHPTRNAIGWSLALLAAGVLSAAGFVLVRLVARSRPKLAFAALIGVVTGWAGTAAVASGGLVMGDMAKNPEREAMVSVLSGFNEGNGNTVFFMVLTGVIGNIALAVAFARSGVASRGVAILFGVGAVGSLVASPGPARPVALVAGALLLAGQVLVLRSSTQAAPQALETPTTRTDQARHQAPDAEPVIAAR